MQASNGQRASHCNTGSSAAADAPEAAHVRPVESWMNAEGREAPRTDGLTLERIDGMR